MRKHLLVEEVLAVCFCIFFSCVDLISVSLFDAMRSCEVVIVLMGCGVGLLLCLLVHLLCDLLLLLDLLDDLLLCLDLWYSLLLCLLCLL